jgi:hypothetical protein
MDELNSAALSPTDIERCIVSGWAALDRGDLEGARFALQEVYSVDPTHPALHLLAAAIRRARPRPVPWRAFILVAAIIVGGVLGVRAWNRHDDRPQPASRPVSTTASASTAASNPPLPPSTEPPAEMPSRTGTAGHAEYPALPTAKQNASAPPTLQMDEDVVVRQAIQRFEGAYTNRWGSLAFEHCDVSRESDHAIATCVPRPHGGATDAESDRVWTFALRKSEGSWKIASVQPPPDASR